MTTTMGEMPSESARRDAKNATQICIFLRKTREESGEEGERERNDRKERKGTTRVARKTNASSEISVTRQRK